MREEKPSHHLEHINRHIYTFTTLYFARVHTHTPKSTQIANNLHTDQKRQLTATTPIRMVTSKSVSLKPVPCTTATLSKGSPKSCKNKSPRVSHSLSLRPELQGLQALDPLLQYPMKRQATTPPRLWFLYCSVLLA
jgi:hypothetical protein